MDFNNIPLDVGLSGNGFSMLPSQFGGNIDQLQKAMMAGYGTDAAAFTQGRALQYESMEETLYNALYSVEEAILFRNLSTTTVTSTVHQWNVRDEYGADEGGFIEEGGLAATTDQSIGRKTIDMKIMATKREVSFVAEATNMVDNLKSMEKVSGTLTLLRRIERMLFHGNSSVVPAEFDGLDTSITADPTDPFGVTYDKAGDDICCRSGNIIDLRGKTLLDSGTWGNAEDTFGLASTYIRNKLGWADNAYMSTDLLNDMQKLIRSRIVFPVLNSTEMAGGNANFNNYPTYFGGLQLHGDIFLSGEDVPKPSTQVYWRPDQPTIAAAPIAATVDESMFDAASAGAGAGPYTYTVSAENQYGQSLPSATASATVEANGAIDITITHGANPGTGFRIFRSAAGVASPRKLIARIPASGGATTVFRDCNHKLPNTHSIYILSMNPVYRGITFFQLIPMIEFTLYPTHAAMYPFLVMMAGALGLTLPQRHMIIRNVSLSTNNWYA